MSTIKFGIVWSLDSGLISSLKPGDTISEAIRISERYIGYVTAGSFQIEVGDTIGVVTDVSLAGQSVSFTVQDRYIQFSTVSADTAIEILQAPSASYAILNGTLPPGLSLSETGSLSGVAGASGSVDEQEYVFTIRATVGSTVRDREFAVRLAGYDDPTRFDDSALPKLVTDSASGVQFRSIGSFSRAQHIRFDPGLIDADALRMPIEVAPVTGLPDVRDLHGGLPDGLALADGEISGLIASSAAAGRYLFQVHILRPTGPLTQTFGLDVDDTMTNVVDIVPKIVWRTPEGAIGAIRIGEASYLAIQARAVYSAPIRFSLATGSAPLLEGLTLDPESGNITGRVTTAVAPGQYRFTVRAVSGLLTEVRSFSIEIATPVTTPTFLRVSMPLQAVDAIAISQGDLSLVDHADLFQPENPSFGLRDNPAMYLISSLDPAVDLAAAFTPDPQGIGRERHYHGPKVVLLGDLRTAVARDASGSVIYEVLYRDLVDVQAAAGGYSIVENEPVEEKVLYPQLTRETRYVYPPSVMNARCNFVDRIGFAALDPSLRRTLGPGGPELLPLWMRSEQTLGDELSIPGYKPVLALGYFLPGRAARNLVAIATSPKRVASGTLLHLTKYRIAKGGNEIEISL